MITGTNKLRGRELPLINLKYSNRDRGKVMRFTYCGAYTAIKHTYSFFSRRSRRLNAVVRQKLSRFVNSRYQYFFFLTPHSFLVIPQKKTLNPKKEGF